MSLDALLETWGRWPGFQLAAPERRAWLWLLALALLLAGLRWLWGRRLRLPLLKGEGGAGWLRWAAPLPRLLRLAGLLLLLLALLRPQSFTVNANAHVEAADIMLVLDLSSSMLAQDLKPDRITAAKAALKRFVDGMQGDRLGLTVFSGTAFTQCPLTLDHGVVKQFIDRMQASRGNGATILLDGTALGDAILAAAVRLAQEGSAKDKIMLLATDGIANAGRDPREATALAAGLGIRIYTIGIGQRGGALAGQLGGMPGSFDPDDPAALARARAQLQAVGVRGDEPDEPLLREIARQSGGRYFRATDDQGLSQIYADIAKLERQKVKVKQRRDATEHFFPLLWAGALLLLLEALLRLRLRVSA